MTTDLYPDSFNDVFAAIPTWILAGRVPITSAGHDREPNLTQPTYIEGDP
jgi:hypothetical protein